MLIDGTTYAEELRWALRAELEDLRAKVGIATILVGDDLAAQVYQRRIHRHALELGLTSRPENLPADSTLGHVVGKIAELDADPEISGILVLRPLSAHLPESRVFAALPAFKDVEALHPLNAGLLWLGTPRFVPSTPAAAFHMLDRYTAAAGRDPDVAYDGLNLVLVGRSNNVGKPAAILGLQRNATVISCHRPRCTVNAGCTDFDDRPKAPHERKRMEHLLHRNRPGHRGGGPGPRGRDRWRWWSVAAAPAG